MIRLKFPPSKRKRSFALTKLLLFMMEIWPLQNFLIPKLSVSQFTWQSSNINTITLVWLTVLYKLLFFFRALWSSWRALTHRTRSLSLSVSISCVSDSPGGVICDAVTCHRQHTSRIRACTYTENRPTCLLFYSKKQKTRNNLRLSQALWQDWITYPEDAL